MTNNSTKQKIAFDIDSCLIMSDNRPNFALINILRWFHYNGCDIVVWSGGGRSYAESMAHRLGIDDLVIPKAKGSVEVDIAFDDEEVTLGKVNVKVI